MSLPKLLLVCALSIPVFIALFWHWNAYSAYRMLSDRIGNESYYWFAFHFQTPNLAKLFPGYVDHFGSLPDDLAARVAIARRRMRLMHVALAISIILIVVLFLVSISELSDAS
ncbi:MAG: hypothetical protein AB7I42_04970 [Bradyrhizobium sp.]|uniref:hypothetical protein n=1 Tax=Bradyrhizobium sp. TaxID=376 RepID=UPI003D0C8DFA